MRFFKAVLFLVVLSLLCSISYGQTLFWNGTTNSVYGQLGGAGANKWFFVPLDTLTPTNAGIPKHGLIAVKGQTVYFYDSIAGHWSAIGANGGGIDSATLADTANAIRTTTTLQSVTNNDSVTTRQITTAPITVTPVPDSAGSGVGLSVRSSGYTFKMSQLNPKASDFFISFDDRPNFSGTGNSDAIMMLGYNKSRHTGNVINPTKAAAVLEFEQSYYIGGSTQDTASEFHYNFVNKLGQTVRPFAIYNAQNEDYRLNNSSIMELYAATGFISNPTYGNCFSWDSLRGPVISSIAPVGDFDIFVREKGSSLTGAVRHLDALPVSKVSGAHSGSISSNTIPKSTGSTAFTNSNLSDNGTTVTSTVPMAVERNIVISSSGTENFITFLRNGTNVNGGLVGLLTGGGRSSTDVIRAYARTDYYSTSITNGAEIGKIALMTMRSGTLDTAVSITGNATVVKGSLSVGTGVSQGGGIKHARVTTGSIAAGASALVTLTWATAFANGNYTVNASVVDATAATASLSVVHIESITASAITVRVVNNSAGSLTGTVHAIAMHD